MRRERSRGRHVPAQRDDFERRSEVGDTLVEILISITVLGVAGIAILLMFATSILGSSDHRNLTTMDVMLRTAAAQVTADIQQQPASTFANCSGAYVVNNTTGITLPTPPAGYSATIKYAQYWNGTTHAFTSQSAPSNAGCPFGVTVVGTAPNTFVLGPQQLTIQVTFKNTNQLITTVVQDPAAPSSTANCGDPATQLVWVAQPAGGEAGSALTPPPTVVLEDASGCVEQQDASSVQLSIASGPAGATLNNCNAFPGNGETTFEDCSLNTIGTYTLQASDPTDGIAPVPSNPFAIVTGTPARLVFQGQPANGTVGTPFATSSQPIIVWIEDASGNVLTGDNSTVSLAIGNNPGSGTLSGCGSAGAVNGVATFTGCTLNTAGNGYTLTATDSTDGLTNPAASNAFNIAKASPTVTATGPANDTAGTAIATTSISSVFAASSGTNATGTITFKVFGPQNTAPTACTTGGTTVGTVTPAGNGTYHPNTGFTPTGIGNYWWYASYGGDTNNNTATSTCGSSMSETVVGKAAPTLSVAAPGSGAVGSTIGSGSINATLAAVLGHQRRQHDHLQGLRPPGHRPHHLHCWRDDGRHGDPGGQRHLQPLGRLHADTAGQLLVVRVGAGGREQQRGHLDLRWDHGRDRGGQGVTDGDGDGPAERLGRHRHHGGQHQLGVRRLLGRQCHRHHHLHRLRSPGHRTDHLHHRRHRGGDRHGDRQQHLSPERRLHPRGGR